MSTSKVLVALDNIRSVYNVGSFFRSADGSGVVEKLILGGYTPAPPRRDIAKTALGAEQVVPFTVVKDLKAELLRLQAEGYTLVAIEQTAQSINLADYVYPERVCLILGNEVDGVSPSILEICAAHVELPMRGMKRSLNVSVTAGIVLYDLARKGF